MRQDVNLYQPLLRTTRSPLELRIILRLWLLFILALTVVYAVGLWTTMKTSQELQRLHTDTLLVERRLHRLEARARAHRPSPLLEQAIAEARARLARRQAALDLLHHQRYGNRQGFASTLVDLGQAIVPQLWLTRISIRRGGSDLLLAGRTRRPAALPRYVARLLPLLRHSGDPAPRFHVLLLERLHSDRSLYRFVVATRLPSRARAAPRPR